MTRTFPSLLYFQAKVTELHNCYKNVTEYVTEKIRMVEPFYIYKLHSYIIYKIYILYIRVYMYINKKMCM